MCLFRYNWPPATEQKKPATVPGQNLQEQNIAECLLWRALSVRCLFFTLHQAYKQAQAGPACLRAKP